MHVNVKIYIRFQILLVWTFTEYYMNIFGGAERYSGPPRNNFGGAAAPPAPPLPTPLNRELTHSYKWSICLLPM